MKVVKVKRKKEILFFPHTFPHEVKGQSFEYFISGEGYKKTKAFDILNEEIPEQWSGLSWLEIMYIHNTVGIVLSYMPKRNVPVLSLSKTYFPDIHFFRRQSICYAGKPMLLFLN